jgi:hypothetical protein
MLDLAEFPCRYYPARVFQFRLDALAQELGVVADFLPNMCALCEGCSFT